MHLNSLFLSRTADVLENSSVLVKLLILSRVKKQKCGSLRHILPYIYSNS